MAAKEEKAPKAEAPKAEAPKAEAPKAEAPKAVDPHAAGAKYRVKKAHKSPVQVHVPGALIAANLIIPGNAIPKDADEKCVKSLLSRGIIEEVK
jgi:hypothetical protein